MENGNLNETTTFSSRPVTATASAETVTPAGSGGSGSSVKSGVGRLGQSAYRQSSATTPLGTNQTTLLTAKRCLFTQVVETVSNMKGAGESLSSRFPGFLMAEALKILFPFNQQICKLIEEDERVKSRELARIANRDCGDGGVSSVPLTEANCLVHVLPNNVPEFIIYRGQKYFPELTMDEKIKEIGELKNTNKELTNKVRRLETLVNLKENHLEDLTRQLDDYDEEWEFVNL